MYWALLLALVLHRPAWRLAKFLWRLPSQPGTIDRLLERIEMLEEDVGHNRLVVKGHMANVRKDVEEATAWRTEMTHFVASMEKRLQEIEKANSDGGVWATGPTVREMGKRLEKLESYREVVRGALANVQGEIRKLKGDDANCFPTKLEKRVGKLEKRQEMQPLDFVEPMQKRLDAVEKDSRRCRLQMVNHYNKLIEETQASVKRLREEVEGKSKFGRREGWWWNDPALVSIEAHEGSRMTLYGHINALYQRVNSALVVDDGVVSGLKADIDANEKCCVYLGDRVTALEADLRGEDRSAAKVHRCVRCEMKLSAWTQVPGKGPHCADCIQDLGSGR